MAASANLSTGIRVRLSVMMFLQYAFQGIWLVTLGTYLSSPSAGEFTGVQIGSAFSMVAIGFIVSPFIVGMIADRFFSAQRILGVLNLAAAGFLFLASQAAVSSTGEAQPTLFLALLLAHCICYTPSWALTNTIAFNQMTNPGKQFPSIRVMGTLGWIAVGAISLFSKEITPLLGAERNIETTNLPMVFGACIGLAAGLFAFALPATPPKNTGGKVTFGDIIGVRALVLFKDRNFAVFALSSFLIMFSGVFYWNFANMFLNESNWEAAMFKMTLGQMSELVFLVSMPWFFARWGVKRMLLIGFAAWALRFVFFSFGDTGAMVALLYGGIILHGVCFDFFFVTGQLYTDHKAPKEVQASAQGLLSLIINGLGAFFGAIVSGNIVGIYAYTATVDGVDKTLHHWNIIWLFPAAMAFVFMIFFFIAFKDDIKVGEAEA
jgi:nucleoside transporter